jgi:hypothetical protein
LEICPFSALSTVPREEGKEMAFPRQPFSLFFFESIFEPCPGRPKSDDQMGWVSLLLLGFGLG